MKLYRQWKATTRRLAQLLLGTIVVGGFLFLAWSWTSISRIAQSGAIGAGNVTWWMWAPLLGIGLLVVLIHLASSEAEVWEELRLQAGYYRWHVIDAGAVGIGLSFCLISAAIAVAEGASVLDLTAAIVTIFVGLLGAMFGINALYWRNAPFRDLFRLMRSIESDLRQLPEGGESSRLWIVYQALNIGYYRCTFDNKGQRTDFHSRYWNLHASIMSAAGSLQEKARAVTYDPASYKEYFTAYLEPLLNGKVLLECAAACAQEAQSFRDQFKQEGGQHYSVQRADEFPSETILIGNTVYFIVTHGLPRLENGKFESSRGSKSTAVVLAYRHENPELANLVESFLKARFESSAAPIVATPASAVATP